MQKDIKRTRIFVSREIQGRILGRLFKYWFLYNFAVWHGLLLIDMERYGVATLLSRGPSMSFFEFYKEFAAQHMILLGLAAALSPFLLWDMLKLTHQVAGPLVRFRHTLRKMANGEPVEKIELRKGDLLIEFQDAFNEFLESNRLIVGELQRTTGSGVGGTGNVDPQARAVLTAVADLQAGFNSAGSNSTGNEPARAAVM